MNIDSFNLDEVLKTADTIGRNSNSNGKNKNKIPMKISNNKSINNHRNIYDIEKMNKFENEENSNEYNNNFSQGGKKNQENEMDYIKNLLMKT